MAGSFELKRHDQRPFFVVALTDEAGIVNLTTATNAYFNMGTSNAGVLGAAKVTRGSATISDAVNGVVSYAWGTADTNASGQYLAEMVVIWNDGKQETYPGGPTTGPYWQVVITDDIDNV